MWCIWRATDAALFLPIALRYAGCLGSNCCNIKLSLLPAGRQVPHPLKHLHMIANCSLCSKGNGFSYRASLLPSLETHAGLSADGCHLEECFRENTVVSVGGLSLLDHVQALPTALGSHNPPQEYPNGKYKSRSLMAIHRHWEFCANLLNCNVKLLQELHFANISAKWAPFKTRKVVKLCGIKNIRWLT